ncbi:hypothetical protein NM208_g1465 [Fusarium decemcellulare]|uniref:Uncharacterized protein n=1 Tax=Fusarium decemcellulare TaxID=57161 RepID=A0ACC1SW72_9HYPO|nr:hypothetical protein NM208_g1465 [Fusarium decemcellulare]
MRHIVANLEAFSALKATTVVIASAATGIRRAFATEAHRRRTFFLMNSASFDRLNGFSGYGGNLVVGDVAVEAGQSLQDQVSLFRGSYSSFGNINVIIATAAVVDYAECFAIGDDDIDSEPPLREVDINVRRVMFKARIGLHYLQKTSRGDNIMISSVGGFKDTAYLTLCLDS